MRRERRYPGRGPADPRSPGRGFTLVEVLVAFAITALVVTAALQLFDGGSQAGARYDRASRALILAEARLFDPALDSRADDPGIWQGESDGFAWQVSTEKPADGASLQRLTATVRWSQGRIALSRHRFRPAAAE